MASPIGVNEETFSFSDVANFSYDDLITDYEERNSQESLSTNQNAQQLPGLKNTATFDEWIHGDSPSVSESFSASSNSFQLATTGNKNAQQASLVLPDLVPSNIPESGVPLAPYGHCKAFTPIFSAEAADNVTTPGLREAVHATSWTLGKIDWGIDQAFYGVANADEALFYDGIDHVTGVRNISEPYQTYARWGERTVLAGVATGLGSYGYQFVKNPEFRQAGLKAQASQTFQSSKNLWKKHGMLYGALFLTSTQLPSHAAKGLDLIDPDQEIFKDDTRKYARMGTYGLMMGGSALVINEAYRKVYAPQAAIGVKPPIKFWTGLGAAGFYGAYNLYWDNFSAQQRILPALYDKQPSAAYNPLQWDWNYTQGHTTSAEMLMWGATGAAWGSLLGWQNGLTSKLMKKTLGFGDEVLTFTPKEQLFVNRGTWLGSRFARGSLVMAKSPKRVVYTGVSSAIGLPLGIAIGKAMYQAQAYSSKEATSGTSLRAVITSPMSTVGMNVFAAGGRATGWEAYAPNMLLVNYSWRACSTQGQSLFQVARRVADDYKASTNPEDQLYYRTQLYNLYSISYDNGKDFNNNEKLQIKALMEEVGIDVDEIREELRQLPQ